MVSLGLLPKMALGGVGGVVCLVFRPLWWFSCLELVNLQSVLWAPAVPLGHVCYFSLAGFCCLQTPEPDCLAGPRPGIRVAQDVWSSRHPSE